MKKSALTRTQEIVRVQSTRISNLEDDLKSVASERNKLERDMLDLRIQLLEQEKAAPIQTMRAVRDTLAHILNQHDHPEDKHPF